MLIAKGAREDVKVPNNAGDLPIVQATLGVGGKYMGEERCLAVIKTLILEVWPQLLLIVPSLARSSVLILYRFHRVVRFLLEYQIASRFQ